ncbi:hypothetical protein DICVIV_00353 [Dictyocaulus viviparus]|uniref:Uncharacterized protein n=1 Tax=Dictyocaulus viviparus TaxID=29172 RepID=A0A0D8Y9J8_DICVI|nr:hypothetical protein DICVIV_00353 [Dictyocaulus viviparus]
MDNGRTATNKPALAKVKPMLKKSNFSMGLNTLQNPPIVVPFSRTFASVPVQAHVRRFEKSRLHSDLVKKNAHIEALRQKISDLFQRAASANCHSSASSKWNSTAARETPVETYDSHLARLVSQLIETQSKSDFQTFFQRILGEIDSLLMKYIDEQQLRKACEHNERQMEDLTLMFDQLIRQKECAHQRDVHELQGRIDYIQDELVANRMANEMLQQQLANANSTIVERSQDMGRTMEEIDQLRNEVKQLRSYKKENEYGIRNINQLYEELYRNKSINEEIIKEFVKIENERDELCSTFTDSLMRIRRSNERKREAIEAELNDIETLLKVKSMGASCCTISTT